MNVESTLLVLLTAASLVHCSETASESSNDALIEISATLSATSDPLVGNALTPFEGMRLSMNPSSNTAQAQVIVSAARGDDLLPDNAVPLGRRFQVDVESKTSNLLVDVELPYYPESIDSVGLSTSNAGVWVKHSKAWNFVTADTVDNDATKITIDQSATLVSGIKITTPVTAEPTCLSMGACPNTSNVEMLGLGAPRPHIQRITTSGTSIFYVTLGAAPKGEALQGVRIESNGDVSTSSPLVIEPAGEATRNRGIAVDNAGDLWLGTRTGVAVLRFGSDSKLIAAPSVPCYANGVGSTGDGTVVWISLGDTPQVHLAKSIDDMTVATLAAGQLQWSTSAALPNSLSISPMGDSGFMWTIRDAKTVNHFQGDAHPLPMASKGPIASVKNQLVAIVGEQSTISWGGQATMKDYRVSAIVPDQNDGLWAALIDSPGVLHIVAGVPVQYVPLAQSESSRVEASQAIPKSMATTDNALIVLTRAGDLFRVTELSE